MQRAFFVVLGGLIAAMLGLPEARADAIDCAKPPPVPIARIVCDDPALSLLDEGLAEAYAMALDAALDPASLRSDESDWFDHAVLVYNWYAEHGMAVDKESIAAAYQAHIAELREVTRRWREARAPISGDSLATSCIVLPPYADRDTCRVTAAGAVEGDPSLRYQLQSVTDPDAAGPVVVLRDAPSKPGMLVAILAGTARHEGKPARYDTPRLIEAANGPFLLLKGLFPGSAGTEAAALYRYRDQTIREIDTTSWIEELRQHLPAGLQLLRDLGPDYATMTATSRLWRQADSPCCPSGPQATIDLAIEGDRLVIKHATLSGP